MLARRKSLHVKLAYRNVRSSYVVLTCMVCLSRHSIDRVDFTSPGARDRHAYITDKKVQTEISQFPSLEGDNSENYVLVAVNTSCMQTSIVDLLRLPDTY